jgi:hypothetical protein
VGGLFFSIGNARFVDLQLLSSPRNGEQVRAVAPQIVDKVLYLRTADGRERSVRATGELPSRSAIVGAVPPLGGGQWTDDDFDRRWRAPTPAELRADIDHFHIPPRDIDNRDSWAEWHYFNVLSSDKKRWAFLSFIVGGAVPDGLWGGQVLLTLHQQGKPARRFSAVFPSDSVSFSTSNANLKIGTGTVALDAEGRYLVHARARGDDGSEASVDLTVTPSPGVYLPDASLGIETFVSGYAAAGLRADATGTICAGDRCERYDAAQAYHDHNWGAWRGVTWEWGAARAGSYTFLYGRVEPAGNPSADAPLIFYLADSLGFRTAFRPRRIDYTDGRTLTVTGGRALQVPSRAVFADIRGDDTLRVELDIEDAVATDTRQPQAERGETMAARALARPYFIQMKGTARLSGRVGGSPIAGEGTGFFETYR